MGSGWPQPPSPISVSRPPASCAISPSSPSPDASPARALTPSAVRRVDRPMQVQVTGKHVDVGEALRSRVSDEITTSIGKYFDRDGGGADVVVSREGDAFKVDCAVTLASGQQLTTHGVGDDAHLAFDAALEKLSKRIRRYKNRLKSHHGQQIARQAEN